MKEVQNTESNIPPLMMQQNIIQNQDTMNRFNQLYDDDFISLINGLSDSIKEYYKVSRNNIKEANSFLSFYEQEGKSIQLLMDQIINSNSYKRVNEVFQQIPKINKIMSELKKNTNSNELNLNLFFDDAKILFKRMKLKRKEKLVELQNSNGNNEVNILNNNQGLNDSFSNSYNVKQSKYIAKYNLINKNNGHPFSRINRNMNSQNSAMLSINNIYSQIMKLLNSFSEFNFMISKMNFEASNKYSNLQNNIKKELDILMNFVKNNLSMNNQNKLINSIISNFSDEQSLGNQRSKSIKENEKLKQINLINEKKIKDLNNQLNTFRKNNSPDSGNIIRDLKLKNNNLNLKLMKAEQQIKEKDDIIMNLSNNYTNNQNNLMNINNDNINLNNNLKQKDNLIFNLQQQLYVYQNNENLLNSQITDLNNQFQTKINQYESQISNMNNKIGNLSKLITNKNKDIVKFQKENNECKKEIDQLKKLINSQRLSNPNNNIIEEYEETIQRLQNDLNYYQNMLNQYENQIMELSNNNNGLNNNYNIENNNFALQKKIEMLNRELQMKENEFKKEKEMIINKNSLNEQKINAMNTQNHKIIEEQKMKINQLNKEITNYQKKEKAFEENNIKYIKQIEDMNNNIINTNKIMEQKDELIKQLNEKKNEHFSPDINNNINNNINLELKKERDDYKFQFEQMQKKYISTKELLDEKNLNSPQNNNVNTNDMLKMKLTDMELENEKLRKEIDELKNNNNNNNILLNDKIIDGNNIQNNNNYLGNNESLTKIKELTLENQKYKENITKLESDINKKNEELEGLKVFIFKLQSRLEENDDNKKRKEGNKDQKKPENVISMKRGENENLCMTEPNRREKKNNDNNKSFEAPNDANTAMISNLLNNLNDSEKKIAILQKKIKELQYQLEDKQVEKEISGYRTEDVNFSNYEEEFDLKKMVNGAREKNRSEDINIDYPGVQGIKDKYRELLQNMNMLEEQVKILICNINCTNKIKPQITQICQLMRISPKNIQLIIAGKDKKKALGLIG